MRIQGLKPSACTGALFLALALSFAATPAAAVEVTGQYTETGRAAGQPAHPAHKKGHAASHKAAKGSFKLLSEKTIEAKGRTEKTQTFRAKGGTYMLRTTKSKSGVSVEAFKETSAGTKSKWRAVSLSKLPATPEVKKLVVAANHRKQVAAVVSAPEKTPAPPPAPMAAPQAVAPVAVQAPAPIAEPPAPPKPAVSELVKPEPAPETPPAEEKAADEPALAAPASAAEEEAPPAPHRPSLTFVKPTTAPSPATEKPAAKAAGGTKEEDARFQKFLTDHPRFCPGTFYGGSSCH